MNIEKIRSKKALKLLGLLISALFIATASAQLYTQMFMYATVTVEGQYVRFVSAGNTSDLGGTVTPGGEEVTFIDMKGYNGTLAPWSEAVNITNTHASTGYNITLQVHEFTGDSEFRLRYINVTMYEGGTKKGNTIHLVPGAGDVDTTGKQVLGAGDKWRVQWDIWWWGNATTANTVSVTLKLIVEA